MSKRTYELIYVLKPDAPESEVADMHKQVADIVERMGGTIDKSENAAPWGRRKLAYEIGHHKEGFYVLEQITGSGELMKEIDRRLKVTEGLLRLIVRVDESASGRSRPHQAPRRIAPAPRGERAPDGSRVSPQEDSDDSGDMMFDGAEAEVCDGTIWRT